MTGNVSGLFMPNAIHTLIMVEAGIFQTIVQSVGRVVSQCLELAGVVGAINSGKKWSSGQIIWLGVQRGD